MIAETAELVAEMNLRGDFPRQAAKMQRSLGGLNADTKKLKDGLGKVGQGIAKGFKSAALIGAGAAGFLALQVRAGLESLAELDDVQRQTAQAIKSTGGVAKVTANEVRKLAEKYEDLTTVDDKVIQQGENLLLGFTNLRKKAFEPTIAAALDMASALDMDTTTAFRTLGRALNDPAAGLARLTRLGVSFTEEEKKKVTALVESGKRLEAQRFILGRLNRLYGGRAASAAAGYRGTLNRLNDAVEGLQQNLARPLIGPLTRVASKLAKFANTDDVQAGIRGIGEAFASLFEAPVDTNASSVQDALSKGLTAGLAKTPFEQGLDKIKEGFDTIKALPWDDIKSNFAFVGQVASKAVDIFNNLDPRLQTALITMLAANKLTGGLVASGLKDIAGVALSSLKTITAANVTVIGTTVTGPGGPNLPTPGPKPTGPSLPFGIFGGASVLMPQPTTGEADRVANEILAKTGTSVEQLIAIAQLARVGTSVTQRIADDTALQARLTPIQNPLLDAIANNTTTIPEDGREQANLQRVSIEAGKKAAQSLQQRTAEARAAIARQTPILGRVVAAANDTAAAIRNKDLSVKVGVSLSATTVVEGVTRSTSQNRVIIS